MPKHYFSPREISAFDIMRTEIRHVPVRGNDVPSVYVKRDLTGGILRVK